MKKLIFSLAVLLSAWLLGSCDYNPRGEHCFKLTVVFHEWLSDQQQMPKQETTQYFWGTKDEMKEFQQDLIDQLEAIDPDAMFVVEVELTNKTKAECYKEIQ